MGWAVRGAGYDGAGRLGGWLMGWGTGGVNFIWSVIGAEGGCV